MHEVNVGAEPARKHTTPLHAGNYLLLTCFTRSFAQTPAAKLCTCAYVHT